MLSSFEQILSALSDAYLQVGVWVAVMVWLCGWLRDRPNGHFARLLAHRRVAPWIGALLGVWPGCGGAIVVMPLYTSGATSFGAVVATLIATMGNSSFVMLAARPRLGLVIHTLLFILGGLCGMLVDALKLGPKSPKVKSTQPLPTTLRLSCGSVGAKRVATGLMGKPESPMQRAMLALFWAWACIGLYAAIATSFFRVDPNALPLFRSTRSLEVFCAAGALYCIIIAMVQRKASRTASPLYASGTPGLAVESAHETSPVVFWVALSFLATSALIQGVGIDVSVLKDNEHWAVLAGAAVGLIPGCGPQIVLTGLFIEGLIGFPVLLANAVSQDGDALLPLLAKDPKAATRATLLTTIPAIVLGFLALTWMT